MDDLMAEIAAAKKRKVSTGGGTARVVRSGGGGGGAAARSNAAAEQRARQKALDEKRKRRRKEREAEEAAYEARRAALREKEAAKWQRKRGRPGGASSPNPSDGGGAAAAGGDASASGGGDGGGGGGAGAAAAGADSKDGGKDTLAALTVSEVKRALRRKGQPVTRFGESDAERLARLRAIESREVEEGAEDFKLGQGHDMANAMMDEDDGTDGPAPAAGGGDGAERQAPRPEIITSDFGSKGLNDYKLVTKYWKFLLKQWELDLAARPDAVKASVQGRVEVKTMRQCKDYMKPLFRLLKDKALNPSILDSLKTMVLSCEAGNFRAAGDAYIQISIGNAAWPIGLTMVGIHERTGREKISNKNVAHVMNNELQRKYLTSVKRLMNYAQRRRPDVPPSMKVMN